MIIIKQIKVNAEKIKSADKIEYLLMQVAKIFHLNPQKINDFRIVKEAIDARKKPMVFYSFNVVLTLDKVLEKRLIDSQRKYKLQIDEYHEISFDFPTLKNSEFKRPLIVGSGPAGLFAAYMLSEAGYRPILVERGSSIEERKSLVSNFFKTGELDKNSNIQFGEGGAGTFSDGKLNTGTKDKAGIHQKVLDIFVMHGANPSITYENKPHIGTDVLEKIVVSMRNSIVSNGGTVCFNKKLSGLKIVNNNLYSVVFNGEEEIKIDNMILAIGHSARDTFKMIYDNNIKMEQKAFAVGVRVVHEQAFVDISQYDSASKYLPAADYKITSHTSNGKNVYSFCMCPGGFVVSAASDEGEAVVNGMSYSKRNGKYANAAMLVNVNSDDFNSDDIFAGMKFQKQLEKKAYSLAGGKVPIQSFDSFLKRSYDECNEELLNVANESVLGRYECSNVAEVFPDKLHTALCEGLKLSDSKINGFSENIKLIAGVETRTSSPVKILRNEFYESNISGVFPCGEGAGYAGGIMSAAVDGIKVATAVAKRINGEL